MTTEVAEKAKEEAGIVAAMMTGGDKKKGYFTHRLLSLFPGLILLYTRWLLRRCANTLTSCVCVARVDKTTNNE